MDTSSTFSERQNWLDRLKGIAILLVILGHLLPYCRGNSKWPDQITYIIYCVHMPLFFIASGWSYHLSLRRRQQSRPSYCYILSHCFDFGWAAVVFTILHLLLPWVQKTGSFIRDALAWANQYWYLAVLILIYLGMSFVMHIEYPHMAVLLALSFLCGLIQMDVAKFLLYMFFFSLGRYFAQQHEKSIKWGERLKKGGLFAGVLFCALSAGFYWFAGGELLMDVYSKAILGVTGSIFILSLVINRDERGILTLIGQNTLIIYLTHFGILKMATHGRIYHIINDSLISMIFLLLETGVGLTVWIWLMRRFPLLQKSLLKPAGTFVQYRRKTKVK